MPALLITGGTGKLGAEIARQLAAMGITGRALVRTPEKATPLIALGFETVVEDLAHPSGLARVLESVDRVLLLTGDDPRQVALQANLVDAAAAAGVGHIVKVSAKSAGLTPPVSFGVAHREIEQRLEQSGLSFTIVRPYTFMQNFVRFALNFAAHGRIIAPVKDAGVALVDMRDVAAVVTRTLARTGHEGRIYEVSGPETLTFARSSNTIAHVIGRSVKHVSPPPYLAGVLLRLMTKMPTWEIPHVVELFGAMAKGSQQQVTTVVADVVGQIPRTFDDFVREHAELFGKKRG